MLINSCRVLLYTKLSKVKVIPPKSLYRSRAGRHSYGTENEIWAGFELVGNTEKNWANYEQLLKVVVSCFQGQKKVYIFFLIS